MFYGVLFMSTVILTWAASSLEPLATLRLNTLEAQRRIMNGLSWKVKSSLLKQNNLNVNVRNNTKNSGAKTKVKATNDTIRTKVSSDHGKQRQVAMEALELSAVEVKPPADQVKTRRDDGEDNIEIDEDMSMKMKLFRLMYETVRDSDLKVKRAEIIKKYYANSTAFEIGFLIGDITDKHNVMSDIAQTLKRLYHEWRPLEHVNAYEQIANLAIEVGRFGDLVLDYEEKLAEEKLAAFGLPPGAQGSVPAALKGPERFGWQ